MTAQSADKGRSRHALSSDAMLRPSERPTDRYRMLAVMLGKDEFTVNAITDGQHRAHAIYKLLRELKGRGFIEERVVPTGEPGAQRHIYRFTPTGRKTLQRELEDLFRDL